MIQIPPSWRPWHYARVGASRSTSTIGSAPSASSVVPRRRELTSFGEFVLLGNGRVFIAVLLAFLLNAAPPAGGPMGSELDEPPGPAESGESAANVLILPTSVERERDQSDESLGTLGRPFDHRSPSSSA